MKKTYFQNLCIKDITNNISDNEKQILIQWLEKSEENKVEYKNIRETWNLTKPNTLEYKLNIEDEWSNLNENITSNPKIASTNKTGKVLASLFSPKFKPIWATSAALVLIISSLFVFNTFNSSNKLKIITSQNNERLEVVFNDGSFAQLNSGSELQFYEDFENDKRNVILKGEAFFSVKKDGRPFIITTDNAITTVLGTQFNVWSRSNETRVIVKEGKVSLAENSLLGNRVILTRGELSKVKASLPPIEPTKVDADHLLGWLDGKLVFDNTSLQEIAEEFERFYNVEVSVELLDLAKYNLTGSFEDKNIKDALAKLCLALNLNFNENNNNYVITK